MGPYSNSDGDNAKPRPSGSLDGSLDMDINGLTGEALSSDLGQALGERAQTAFERMKPRLDDLPAHKVSAIQLDLQKATLTAIAVGRRVCSPEVIQRFGRLPADLFALSQLEDLEPAALAAWHANGHLIALKHEHDRGRLPTEMVISATIRKSRMLAVASYYLGDHPQAAAEIASIRSGHGECDLATELVQLAQLYESHSDILIADTKHFCAEDAVEARRQAERLFRVLEDCACGPRQYWSNYQARSWTLLLAVYDEVSAAGRWLYRHDRPMERFPLLHALVRRRRASSQFDPV